jgi:hypothetical protein
MSRRQPSSSTLPPKKPRGRVAKKAQEPIIQNDTSSEDEADASTSTLSQESDGDDADETLVMELPVDESQVKGYLRGKIVSSGGKWKPMVESESHSEDDCDECRKKDLKIKELKDRLRGAIVDDSPDRFEIDIDIIDADGKKSELKNIKGAACMWCTETFTGEPSFIPMGWDGDKLRRFGYFCQESCAAAFNLKEMNDVKVRERHGLINWLASKRYGRDVAVKPAGTPYSLKKFQGRLSIDEFRKIGYLGRRAYQFVMPSTIQMKPMLELDQMFARPTGDAGLVLKREKPLNTISSLEQSSMRLRIKEKKKKVEVDSD